MYEKQHDSHELNYIHVNYNKKFKSITFTTGGEILKSREFSVKSSTLNVADMMTSLSGFPL